MPAMATESIFNYNYSGIPNNFTTEFEYSSQESTAFSSQSTEPPPATIYKASPAVIAVFAVMHGSISLLALLGNSLVVLIIVSNKRMQSVTNFLLANLASADILIAVAAIPFQFQAALLQKWVLPDFMCIVAPFVQVLSVNVSIFTLVVISIERYRALLYPFKARITKSAAGYAIAVIWILAVICASPMAASLRVALVDDQGEAKPFCYPNGLITPFNDSQVAFEEATMRTMKIFHIYVLVLVAVQFLIPLIIIGFAYITIARHLWGSQGPGELNEQNVFRTKQRQKVIKMLILVVTLFAVCWFPLQAYNFATVVFPEINSYRYINLIWFCCNFLAMSNSCQNPFILGFYNEKFRRELRSKFRLCFCLRRGRSFRASSAFNAADDGETMGYSITKMERVRRSTKRCANHARSYDDSPIYGNHKSHNHTSTNHTRVPQDPSEYYD